MSLAVAVQMDPMESVSIDGDTTFALAECAQSRGHRLWHYQPRDLSFRDGMVTARARALTVRRERGNHFTLGPAETLDLSMVDVVLLRQDPPFDMSYITNTHLLEKIHPRTLVVNDPVEVRNAPEKLFLTRFPGLMPPTLVSADPDAIRAFRAEHRDIILKPLYGNGGAGVFHLKPDDENLGSLLDMFFQQSREPLMIQRYLPEVRKGDKRIILVDGKPVGALNRIPADGDARSNMHAGGKPVPAELTPREEYICATIGPELKSRGLILAGIDVIGDWLTEINVTSPTGIQEIRRFDGTDIASLVWDAIESRRTRPA